MPHHWHPVAAQDKPLNIRKVERAPRRLGLGLVSSSIEQMTEQTSAFFRLWRMFFDVLTHWCLLLDRPLTPIRDYAAEPASNFLSAIKALMSCTLSPGYGV